MKNFVVLLVIIGIGVVNLLINSVFQKLLSQIKSSTIPGKILPIVYSLSGIVFVLIAIGSILTKDVNSALQALMIAFIHYIHIFVFIKIFKKTRIELAD
ncbi:MAG: hypothetical protein E7262_01445 [Lachnospiraceae bacterium]|nr:hypothetical protein [Lachnospiraceae bacterium]